MNHKQLTHQWILQFCPLDLSIDMTAGNGHDTLFLAQHSKKVIAVDIQTEALKNTKLRCSDHTSINYQLLSHDELVIDQEVSGVMYNLGYLPGSDKTLITQQSTTIKSLQSITNKTKKFITLACYRKHLGGEEEFEAVNKWVQSLPYKITILEYETEYSPVTFLIDLTKKKSLIE